MKHTDWLPGVVLNVVAPVFDGTRTVCNINQTCKHWNMAQLDLCNFNCNTAREGDIPRQQLQRSPPLFPLLLMSTEVCCRALPLSDTKHQPKPGRSKDRRLLTPWTLQESRQTKAAVPTVKHRAQVFQPQTSLTATTFCDLPPPPSRNVSLLETLYRVWLLKHPSTPGGFDLRLAYSVWGSVQVDGCWLWLCFSVWLFTTGALWQRAVQRSDRVTSTRWNPKDTRVRAQARAQKWVSAWATVDT